MTFPILASLLVRLVVLLPFQLLRLSLATPSIWTPLALSVFLHCVVALLLTFLNTFLPVFAFCVMFLVGITFTVGATASIPLARLVLILYIIMYILHGFSL